MRIRNVVVTCILSAGVSSIPVRGNSDTTPPATLYNKSFQLATTGGQDHNYASLPIGPALDDVVYTLGRNDERINALRTAIINLLKKKYDSNSKIIAFIEGPRKQRAAGPAYPELAVNLTHVVFEADYADSREVRGLSVFRTTLAYDDELKGYGISLQFSRTSIPNDGIALSAGYDLTHYPAQYNAALSNIRTTGITLRDTDVSKFTQKQVEDRAVELLPQIERALFSPQEFVNSTRQVRAAFRAEYRAYTGSTTLSSEGINISQLIPSNRNKEYTSGITWTLTAQELQLYQPATGLAQALERNCFRGGVSFVWQNYVPTVHYEQDSKTKEERITINRWSKKVGVEYSFKNPVDDGDVVTVFYRWRNEPADLKVHPAEYRHTFLPEYTLLAGHARSTEVFAGFRVGGNF